MNLLELIQMNILPNTGDGEGETSDLVLQKHLHSEVEKHFSLFASKILSS